MNAPANFIALHIMLIITKHKKYIKIIGFFFLLGVMFVLNNQLEKKDVEVKGQTENIQNFETNISGIAPLTAQIPNKTEGALPIKLISNPNSIFLSFVNYGYEHFSCYSFIELKKRYLKYCARIWAHNITEFLLSLRNRDIQ